MNQIKDKLKKRRVGRQGKTRKPDLLKLFQDAIRANFPVYCDEAKTEGVEGEQAPAIEDGFQHSSKWIE